MNEFDEVIRRLQEGRPELTEPELDEIKQRVRRGVARPSGRTQPMRSRLAILAMLVAGIVFSTAGAGLALDGALNGSNASQAQYGAQESPTPQGGVAGEQASPTPQGGVAGEEQSSPSTPTTESANAVQPARQQAAPAGSSLPFTGFAAIPILVGGLALLGAGLVLRRRTGAQ